MEELWNFISLSAAALAAGVVNAVAGGGTLITFPTLTNVLGTAAEAGKIANVTSTVALFPGSIASAYGYRREMAEIREWRALLLGPSILGGAAGSLLLILLPELFFKTVVPWLILLATLLFLLQPTLSRVMGIGLPHARPHGWTLCGVLVFQFLVATYGGYFGAGIGILMLSSLSLLGIPDIHQMNALKTILASVINGISVIIFILSGKIDWGWAWPMILAAAIGGWLGAAYGRKLPRSLIRWFVICTGFVVSIYFFLK